MGASRWMRTGTAVFAIAESLLLGIASWTRSPLLFAVGQVLLLPLAALLLLARRYIVLRRRYRADLERSRRESERRQLADDVHDMVGHDLSLIAMQAGLLELRGSGPDAEIAAAVRERAQAAVHTLHDTVNLISDHPAHVPATTDVARIVQQSREAGAEVFLTGTVQGTALTRTLVAQVIREGLTNAARHAPGRPVAVQLSDIGEHVQVRVSTNAAAPDEAPAFGTASGTSGRGLTAMEQRLESVGGHLAVLHLAERHSLTATIPKLVPRQRIGRPDDAADRLPHHVARQVLIPLVGIVAAVLIFYSWASHGATIEPVDQARIKLGMTAAAAARLLPAREAPIQLVTSPAHAPGWKCRSFTNGNFPLAVATLEVCMSGGVVVRITDLAAAPPW